MVDLCPVVIWSGIQMEVWKLHWKKTVYGPKCLVFKWSAKLHDFTIWIPPILVFRWIRIHINPEFRCSVFRWLLHYRINQWVCLLIQNKYSEDLNDGLVRYSNGRKLYHRRMVRYSNGIWIPDKKLFAIWMVVWITFAIWMASEYRTVVRIMDIRLLDEKLSAI